jgi:hypothetical protein
VTWRRCRRVATVLAVLLDAVAVSWHAVGGRRGGERSGGVAEGWGKVGEGGGRGVDGVDGLQMFGVMRSRDLTQPAKQNT